jgi:hypothetical protein
MAKAWQPKGSDLSRMQGKVSISRRKNSVLTLEQKQKLGVLPPLDSQRSGNRLLPGESGRIGGTRPLPRSHGEADAVYRNLMRTTARAHDGYGGSPTPKEGDRVKIMGKVYGEGKIGVVTMTSPSGSYHDVSVGGKHVGSYHSSDLQPRVPAGNSKGGQWTKK